MVLNAAGGLVVAVVVKYGDNVLKNFTTSCSVILGTIISVFLFDFHLTAQFAWGAALVISSAYMYGRVAMKDDAASQDSTTGALNCRDSFINCLAFLDCFSDANSAHGKRVTSEEKALEAVRLLGEEEERSRSVSPLIPRDPTLTD